MSRRKATNKVHKSIKRLEESLDELDSDEDYRDEDLEERIEDCIGILELIKQNLKPEGQKNMDKFV